MGTSYVRSSVLGASCTKAYLSILMDFTVTLFLLLLLILHYAFSIVFPFYTVLLYYCINSGMQIYSQISYTILTDRWFKEELVNAMDFIVFSSWGIELIHSYHPQDLKVRENWKDTQLNKYVFLCCLVSSMIAPCTFSII